MVQVHDASLTGFAKHNGIEGLTGPTLSAINRGLPGYTVGNAKQFLQFQDRINRELLRHPVIINNRYTDWFKQGKQNTEQVRAFVVQFSVFSNQFLLAQLNKMINADTLESMRASKEILANEIGVRFKSANNAGSNDIYGTTEGSIEGSSFRFAAAHFEWLCGIANKLNLEFDDIGKPRHGTERTLFFCNELIRLYGGDDYQCAQAASYAVENWAAAGFWGELIQGFKHFNERTGMALPLNFFVWHDRIESQHAEHTQEELEEHYFTHEVDEDAFVQFGNEMLDGVAAFWNGLEEQRKELANIH